VGKKGRRFFIQATAKFHYKNSSASGGVGSRFYIGNSKLEKLSKKRIKCSNLGRIDEITKEYLKDFVGDYWMGAEESNCCYGMLTVF